MQKTITVITKNELTENEIILKEIFNNDISLLEIMQFKDNFLEIYTEEGDTILLSKQVVGKGIEEFIKKFGG